MLTFKALYYTFATFMLLATREVAMAATMVVMQLSIWAWPVLQHVQPEKHVSYQIPATDSTLTIFARRSHPIQPEYERRMELKQPGKKAEQLELYWDTAGANLLDLYSQHENGTLHIYLADRRMYRSWQEGDSTERYPEIDNPHRENWIPLERSFQMKDKSLATSEGLLIKLGQFDTRYMKWQPE